jgi:hypothetical protein
MAIAMVMPSMVVVVMLVMIVVYGRVLDATAVNDITNRAASKIVVPFLFY